jgi:hypothetical protein
VGQQSLETCTDPDVAQFAGRPGPPAVGRSARTAQKQDALTLKCPKTDGGRAGECFRLVVYAGFEEMTSRISEDLAEDPLCKANRDLLVTKPRHLSTITDVLSQKVGSFCVKNALWLLAEKLPCFSDKK